MRPLTLQQGYCIIMQIPYRVPRCEAPHLTAKNAVEQCKYPYYIYPYIDP